MVLALASVSLRRRACRIGEKLYFTTEARSHRVFLNLCTEFSVSLSLCGFKISLLRPEWSSHRRPGCCRQCQCCHQTGFRYLSHCLRSLSLSKSHRPAQQPWLRQSAWQQRQSSPAWPSSRVYSPVACASSFSEATAGPVISFWCVFGL